MNDGLWILLIFTLLLSIPAAAVALVLHFAARRRRNRAARCTASVLGTVTSLSRKGIDRPTIVTVEYQANGQLWHVSESLKLRSEAIRIGKIPIGQRKTPVLGRVEIGDTLPVRYCPEAPSIALIEGNEGHWNT